MEKPWLVFYEEGVPHSLDYPEIPLHRILEDSARRYPGQTALKLVLRYLGPVTLGATLSYRRLLDQVNRFAAALAALGVRKGDRVALMLPNLPQFIIAFYGTLKAGAIVVNTNPAYTAREIEQQFCDSGAETVVLLSGFYSRLQTIQARTQVKRVIITDVPDYVNPPFIALAKQTVKKYGQMAPVPEGDGIYRFRKLLDAHPEAPPDVGITPEDTALFQYTSGTTGIPRAAMLTHRNLVINTVQFRRWICRLEEGNECVMGAIPFFHIYGVTVAMNLAIVIGASLITLPYPRPIDGVMLALQKEQATIFPGVPTMYSGIINHPQVKKYDLRSIEACISGSSALPMDVQIRFGEITGGRLVEGYGLTEAAPVTHCNPIYGQRRNGSIGLPLPDVEARIVDYETFADKPVGEDGELWVRAPQVMKGYWNQPAETAHQMTPDGWLRTGDIAHMDPEGYFYIVDRLKDIIIVSGFNVVPREVEEVLLTHPKVLEAVVAGVPDPARGEAVKAYVVLKPGAIATAEELTGFCADKLARYKIPKQIEFRSELPKTMVGKVLRRVLVAEENLKMTLKAS